MKSLWADEKLNNGAVCQIMCKNMMYTFKIIMQHTSFLMNIVLYTRFTFLHFTILPTLIFLNPSNIYIVYICQVLLHVHVLAFCSMNV